MNGARRNQYQGDYITQEVIDAIAKVDGVVDCKRGKRRGGYWGTGVNFAYFTGAFNIDFTGGYGQSVPYTVTLNSELSAKLFEWHLYAGRRPAHPAGRFLCGADFQRAGR